MLSIDFLNGNYLDILVDASVAADVNSADDVQAVVTLAESSLRAGSNIDVYCDGLFWEAQIISADQERFQFRFLHTGNRHSGGWVWRRDFLVGWRFPVRAEGDVWKAKLVASTIVHD